MRPVGTVGVTNFPDLGQWLRILFLCLESGALLWIRGDQGRAPGLGAGRAGQGTRDPHADAVLSDSRWGKLKEGGWRPKSAQERL